MAKPMRYRPIGMKASRRLINLKAPGKLMVTKTSRRLVGAKSLVKGAKSPGKKPIGVKVPDVKVQPNRLIDARTLRKPKSQKTPKGTIGHQPERNINISAFIRSMNEVTGSRFTSGTKIEDVRRTFKKLDAGKRFPETKINVVKKYLNNGYLLNEIQRSPEKAREVKRQLSAVGVDARHIVATNINHPVFRLLLLDFSRAEIESALRNRTLRTNYESQLNSIIDNVCSSKTFDLLDSRNLPATSAMAKNAFINAVKNGYKAEIISRIRNGRINIPEARKKQLIQQIIKIQPVN